jgi:hypothetical protein
MVLSLFVLGSSFGTPEPYSVFAAEIFQHGHPVFKDRAVVLEVTIAQQIVDVFTDRCTIVDGQVKLVSYGLCHGRSLVNEFLGASVLLLTGRTLGSLVDSVTLRPKQFVQVGCTRFHLLPFRQLMEPL